MILNPEAISAYKTILCDPSKHNLQFPAFPDCFEPCEEITPSHILFEQYCKFIDREIPKIVVYILFEESFIKLRGKAKDGILGML
jgi:hypothetical protein